MGLFSNDIRGDVRNAYVGSHGIWYYEEVRMVDTNVLVQKRICNSMYENLQRVAECFADQKLKRINNHCMSVYQMSFDTRGNKTKETLHYFTEEYGKKKGWLV